jgi:hypothetical protein
MGTPLPPMSPASASAGTVRAVRSASGKSKSFSMPVGTATYNADVVTRAERAATEMVSAFPDLEGFEDGLKSLLLRVLREQDRASRTDEVLGRFSPSVRRYVERQLPEVD